MAPERPVTGELSPETQTTHPFQQEYACRYRGSTGCQFTGSPSELSRHYRVDHRQDREASGGSQAPLGTVTSISEGTVQVPDSEQQLGSFLRVFGLSSRDAGAAVEFLRSYGFDHLPKLDEALRNLNVAVSKRRMILEAWANARGLPLSQDALHTLGAMPLPLDQRRPSEMGELLAGVASLISALRPEPQPDDSASKLLERISGLETQIHDMEKNALKAELDALRQEVKALKESTPRQEELKIVGKRLDALSTKGDRILNLMEPVGLAYSRRVLTAYTGQESSPPIPPPESLGGLSSRLDPKYVTRR